MSITGAVASSGNTQAPKRTSLDQWISQMDTNNDGQISKSEYDAVTSATTKGGMPGGHPKLSFDQLSGGSTSISTSDLKAILEKMRPAGGGHHRSEAISDAASGATTASTSSTTSSAYSANATTGATTSSSTSPSGSDNRLSLILNMLSQSGSSKASYTAEDMKTFLSLMNGINTSA